MVIGLSPVQLHGRWFGAVDQDNQIKRPEQNGDSLEINLR